MHGKIDFFENTRMMCAFEEKVMVSIFNDSSE